MHRRSLIGGLAGLGLPGVGGSVLGLAGCASTGAASSEIAPALSTQVRPPLTGPGFARLITHPGRISHITVCTRPFRRAGPRIEAEAFGDKRLVHNYGHGGAGWSLSWGSANLARDLALAGGTRDVAVIGCGALGLTAALQILRSGARTTIYAAERTPYTRSARATGTWSPASRIADRDALDPGFADRWEAMARSSWAAHHTFVGLDGDPVRFIETYNLRAEPERRRAVGPGPSPGDVNFMHFAGRLDDLGPEGRGLTKAEHPFLVASARVYPNMTFNVAEYARQLTEAFLMEGGRIVSRQFHHPSELSALAEPVVVNCTGYGARALFSDDSVVPVRGQIGWLVPQPDVTYALNYNAVSMVPRHDGIVVQANGASEMVGYGIDDETPNRAETEAALRELATLFPA